MKKFKSFNIPEKQINPESSNHIPSENTITILNAKITDLKSELEQREKYIAQLEKQVKNGNFKAPDVTRYDINTDTILYLKKQGMSNCKIAKQMGCSEGTIRNRILQSKNKGF